MIANQRFSQPPLDACRPGLIHQLLRDDLSDEELRWTTEHLNRCQHCRRLLDDDSQADVTWQSSVGSIRRSLAGTVDNDDASDAQPQAADASTRLPRSIVSWLNPIDDAQRSSGFIGQIDRYYVRRVVGAGGMGVVMEGWDTQLHRPIAIKAMHPHLAAIGLARQRFIREARAAAAVVHPNVVPIHSVYAEHDPPFFLMPLIAGQSLQERIDRGGAMEIDAVLRVASQVADGLAAAHGHGLVHRDIKPANILVEHGTERAMITDFGVVRALDDATVTGSGTIAGTPEYMSPEQARGEAIDHRSDLFSLGSVIYAMLVGRSAFRAETPFGALRRLSEDQPRPIHDTHPHVPDWLVALVERLHSKEPAGRMQSADQLATWLREALSHWQDPKQHALPQEWLALIPRRQRSYRKWIHAGIAACATAVLLAVVAMAMVMLRPPMAKVAPEQPTKPLPQISPVDIDQSLGEIELEIRRLEHQLLP